MPQLAKQATGWFDMAFTTSVHETEQALLLQSHVSPHGAVINDKHTSSTINV